MKLPTFGLKRKPVEAKPDDAEEDDVQPALADGDDAEGEAGTKALPAPPPAKGAGLIALIVVGAAVTVFAAGGGVALGMMTSSGIERAIAAREAAKPVDDHPLSIKYSNDMVLQPIAAVVTNLAAPTDTWVRLETAMVFKNGDLPNPEVAAADLRQDILAYMRTVSLAQLEGPSALQHLREDLNERASLRTGGAVSELIIQTFVVQ